MSCDGTSSTLKEASAYRTSLPADERPDRPYYLQYKIGLRLKLARECSPQGDHEVMGVQPPIETPSLNEDKHYVPKNKSLAYDASDCPSDHLL